MNANTWIALGGLVLLGVSALVGHIMWDARTAAKHGERLARLEAKGCKCGQ